MSTATSGSNTPAIVIGALLLAGSGAPLLWPFARVVV